MLPPARQAVPHSMVRGAMRIAARSRIVVGQAVGDLACALPTRPCRGDVAVGQPCTGAHVPVERRVQITRGLEVFGDQRRVFVDRSGSRCSIAAASRRCSSARSDLSCDS